jgi:hypothetical protein
MGDFNEYQKLLSKTTNQANEGRQIDVNYDQCNKLGHSRSIANKCTLCPPKIIITNIVFLQFVTLGSYGHHILDLFCTFKKYLINFKLILISSQKNSNKTWRIWKHEAYLWQNNTCHKVWKNRNILQN